jgi:phosphotransferase system HPr-like phosphotransfer protein
MKSRHSIVIVAALMMLAACRGERATITGNYGSGVVAGQVAVSGLANSSPAGVQVSIRGTGMTTTLGEDGAFTFAGVPEGAVLVFQRGDGIDATLDLKQTSGFISVALSPNGAAQATSKRRSASSGKKQYEFEGLVKSASDTELVVLDSHGDEVTFTLDGSTIIRKGETPVLATDLKEGDRVHVRATKAEDVYTATLVIVQEDGEGEAPETKEYEGLVRSASDTELVIFDSHGEEVTFVLDANTVITKGNVPVLGSDLKEGDRVHVRATTADDGTKTASVVIVQNPVHEIATYSGTVVSATDTELVISSHGSEITFVLDGSTVIRRGNASIVGSDIKAGEKVTVKATTASDGTKTATEVTVANNKKH